MKYIRVALLTLLLAACDAQTGSHSRTVETPDGPITTTTETVEPTPQQIVPATAAQIATFQSNAARASEFAKAYGVSGAPELKSLDEAFRLWQRQQSRVFTPEEVVEILGACLGETLVRDLNMEWVVVTDEYGTDYAVRAKQSEVMAFPFSSVAKRIERNEHDFMAGVYHTVRSSIESGEYKAR